MAASDFYPPSAHTVVPPVGRRVERKAGSPRPISGVENGREKGRVPSERWTVATATVLSCLQVERARRGNGCRGSGR